MSKKVSAISIALLVFAGSIVGVSSATAATPYKACKPAKAKATIGKISYTCATNPAKTSKALVWVSKQCINAGVNYRDIVEQTDVISKLFQSAITTAERAITNLPKKEKTMTGTSGNQAKKKLKNLQNKKQTVRLARLEKMYQELTEIDAKR